MPYEERPETLAEKRHRLQRAAAKILPHWKVETCGNFAGYGSTLNGRPMVEIRVGRNGVFFGQVVRCQSAWVCPSCGSNLASKRRHNVHRCIGKAQERNAGLFMATLTLSHVRDEPLLPLIRALQGCVKLMKQNPQWQRMKERSGLEGGLTAREPTWGEGAGWHPHTHNIFCFDPTANRRDIENAVEFIFDQWRKEVEKTGRKTDPTAQRLSPVTDATGAAEYVTKYGADWELTHSHLKDAAAGSLTPWQLLDAFSKTGAPVYAARFKEFAEAFKGQRQMTGFGIWRGLPTAPVEFDVAKVGGYIEGDGFAELCKKGMRQKAAEAFKTGGMPALIAILSNAGVAGAWPASIGSRLVKPKRNSHIKKET